jgi:putative DNA primase/helicase
MGNAERIVHLCGTDLRHCWSWGRWLIWDGKRWRQDLDGGIYRKAKETIRTMYGDASHMADDDARKKWTKFCAGSENGQRVSTMISLARSQLSCLNEDLDAHKMLLTVPNGVLDLKTGAMRTFRREDLLTKMTAVSYGKNARCPKWLAFLDLVFNGDVEIIRFLQRAVGYSLTGSVGEKCIFILWGSGDNGKSTFINVLTRLFGEFAGHINSDTLMTKRNSDDKRNDLAALVGLRFVSCSEGEEGARLNESLIKDMTGGDPITCRFLRAEFFTYFPAFKVWFSTNHRPVIRGTDPAVWKRVMLLPFSVNIPAALLLQKKPLILSYENELYEELPGILAWAVEGCLDWQKKGLNPPEQLITAKKDYREQMDIVGRFIEDACTVTESARCLFAELYAAYKDWCELNEEKPMSSKGFARRLDERGLNGTSGRAHVKVRLGITLDVQAMGTVRATLSHIRVTDESHPGTDKNESVTNKKEQTASPQQTLGTDGDHDSPYHHDVVTSRDEYDVKVTIGHQNGRNRSTSVQNPENGQNLSVTRPAEKDTGGVIATGPMHLPTQKQPLMSNPRSVALLTEVVKYNSKTSLEERLLVLNTFLHKREPWILKNKASTRPDTLANKIIVAGMVDVETLDDRGGKLLKDCRLLFDVLDGKNGNGGGK